MSADLSQVPTDELLAELARRCGSSYTPRPRREKKPQRTKAEWAKERAQKARDEYHAATDPSVRAGLMEEMGKFEFLAKRYKEQGL